MMGLIVENVRWCCALADTSRWEYTLRGGMILLTMNSLVLILRVTVSHARRSVRSPTGVHRLFASSSFAIAFSLHTGPDHNHLVSAST